MMTLAKRQKVARLDPRIGAMTLAGDFLREAIPCIYGEFSVHLRQVSRAWMRGMQIRSALWRADFYTLINYWKTRNLDHSATRSSDLKKGGFHQNQVLFEHASRVMAVCALGI
jgi:hypothetical protein